MAMTLFMYKQTTSPSSLSSRKNCVLRRPKASSENALEVAEVRFGCYLAKRQEDVDCQYVELSPFA